MKTAEEVAEEILRLAGNSFDLRTLMTEKITAYAEERVKEAVIDNKIFDHVKKEARSSALEEAASLFHNPKISEQIRALKDKP